MPWPPCPTARTSEPAGGGPGRAGAGHRRAIGGRGARQGGAGGAGLRARGHYQKPLSRTAVIFASRPQRRPSGVPHPAALGVAVEAMNACLPDRYQRTAAIGRDWPRCASGPRMRGAASRPPKPHAVLACAESQPCRLRSRSLTPYLVECRYALSM